MANGMTEAVSTPEATKQGGLIRSVRISGGSKKSKERGHEFNQEDRKSRRRAVSTERSDRLLQQVDRRRIQPVDEVYRIYYPTDAAAARLFPETIRLLSRLRI